MVVYRGIKIGNMDNRNKQVIKTDKITNKQKYRKQKYRKPLQNLVDVAYNKISSYIYYN